MTFHLGFIMRRIRLDDGVDYRFDVYGLITPVREYKLAWLLNRQLGIRLVKKEDIRIDFINSPSLVISNYLYATENSYFRLMKNRSQDDDDLKACLLPELQRFDFIVLTGGMEESLPQGVIKTRLSELPQIQYIQRFEPEALKSRDNLIF